MCIGKHESQNKKAKKKIEGIIHYISLKCKTNSSLNQKKKILKLNIVFTWLKGCDGSVLLDGSASGPSEKSAIPNLTLRAAAFKIINDLQALIQNQCGQVVSCSDITALAARESILLVWYFHYLNLHFNRCFWVYYLS